VQLEDHAGDIVRKARSLNNLSATAVTTATGIPESDLMTFEALGQPTPKINFTRLAKAVGLNPEKFERIANGWVPTPKALTTWRELRVFITAGESLTVNSYLIWDTATRHAALFDTGIDAQPVLDCLATEGLSLEHIFITHSHWDHIDALPKVRAAWPETRIHSNIKKAPASQHNQPGETISLGSLRITHRDTPGHAEDGVTYLISHWPGDAPLVAVVGDTIFAGSMGGGNGAWQLAKQKIQEEILSLPAETLLCSGHGPLTTVAEETAHNPFF